MQNLIDKIYKLIYSPLVTPYNLLSNAKLNNYEYVKYYKDSSGLIAEMKCKIEDAYEIFYYHFDENDFLQEIYKFQNGCKVLIYSRKQEIHKYKAIYMDNKGKRKMKQVI